MGEHEYTLICSCCCGFCAIVLSLTAFYMIISSNSMLQMVDFMPINVATMDW